MSYTNFNVIFTFLFQVFSFYYVQKFEPVFGLVQAPRGIRPRVQEGKPYELLKG